jgi:hypothetical protein
MSIDQRQAHDAASPGESDVGAPLSIVPESHRQAEIPRPRRPTRARMQTFFLRQLERSGSQSDAAARTGVTPRTVRYWRQNNPAFAARYDDALRARLELLEDKAMRRAMNADHRPVFHRGVPIATVERHNDAMLMRVIARFDRLREREAARLGVEPWDLDSMSDIEILKAGGWIIRPPRNPEQQDAFDQQLEKDVDKWLSNFPHPKEKEGSATRGEEAAKSNS